MESKNLDGCGSVFARNGKFIVEKYPTSLTNILKKKSINFLANLDDPNNKGYTLVHLRAASHGKNAYRNTHPFIVGEHAYIHNGVWMDYEAAQLALTNYWRPKGETDSEVAAKVIEECGMKKFWSTIWSAGVFIRLDRKGAIEIAKISGDLMIFNRTNKTALLASELEKRDYKSAFDVRCGYYKFSENGHFKEKLVEDLAPTPVYTSYNSSSRGIPSYQPYSPNPFPHVPVRLSRNEEDNGFKGHNADDFNYNQKPAENLGNEWGGGEDWGG